MELRFDETARPERVGPYRLQEPIGRGGMGTVWRAWDERLKRQVAIKHIRPDTRLPELRQRLWREAQTAARLNHPTIVHIYDLVEDPAGDWIVMELVEGRTLQSLTREKGPLPFAQAVRLGLDISEGLAEAHSHGVLHRDLKTSNVMVTAAGRAKILDFGLAKQIEKGGEDQDLSITMPGMVLGTSYAMSPEQALGHPLDGRSDLFSLGSLLYEILTGEPPFRAATPAASLGAIVSYGPPPLVEIRSGVPRELSDLVGRLLEKDCRARPQSAREVAAALAVLAGAAAPGEGDLPSTLAEGRPLLASASYRGTSGVSEGKRRRTMGEHRLLTVVCCGLARLDGDSGEAQFLDPEDLAEAMAALQALAGEVCLRWSGRSGDTLGHRLWLYFGYPQAREDDAPRAVQAARELIARSAEVGPGWSSSAKQRTALRIAVHTGLAMISVRPGQDEKLQPGPLLDASAGLQDLAPAGEILVTAASRPLIARAFLTEALPAVRLPGSADPIAIFRVTGEVDPWQEEDTPLHPLVGRERELDLLLDRYRLARSGTGQAVMISGEPGIGKSRLVKDLRQRLTIDGAAFRLAYGSLAAQGSPLAPVLDLLERTIFEGEERELRRLEDFLAVHGAAPAEIAPLLAPLLGLSREGQAPARAAHPSFERKKLFEALVALFAEMAERDALVLVIEDLHWADPSTLELLGLLLDEITASSLLLVATFRPEFQAPWGHRTHVTQLGLSRLTDTQATALIDRLLDRSIAAGPLPPLPDTVRQQILARTDGVPLFIEELTKTLLETGRPGELLEIPATLGGSLTARLDRPGPAKEVAQIASVIGRTFSPELLTAIAPLDAAALEQGLDELVHAELVHRRGVGRKARYAFKHALIQDAAYTSLLSRDRQALHLKIAQALEAEPTEAGLLAHHWARAVSPRNPEPALVRRAVPSLLAAGEHTLRLGAYQEARAHLEAALALVQTLPEDGERDEQELPLLVLLCRTLQASLGYTSPEVARIYERAQGLRLRLGDRREISQILYMLWVSRLFEGDHAQALELAREWLAGAERSGRGALSAHGAISHSLYFLGRLPDCLRHAETVLAAPPQEQDEILMDYGLPPRVGAAYYSAWALVHMGQEREALARHELAVELAEKHLDPFGMAMALGASLTFHIRRHDLPAVLRTAGQMKNQAVELGIPGEESLADRARSWALAESGDLDALRDFLTGSRDRRQRSQRVNGKLERGWACHQIASLLLRAGRLEEAGAVLEKGLAAARQGEHLVEAHLGCLKGELHLALAQPAEAEALLREAFALARQGLQPPVAQRAAALLGPLLEPAQAADLQAQVRQLQAETAERVRTIFAEVGSVR